MSEPELDGSYQIVDDGEDLAQPMEEDSDAEEGNPGDDQQQEEQQDDSVHCFTGHSGPVYAAVWNPNNTGQVASGGGDDIAFLWQTGVSEFDSLQETTQELKGHSETVACLEFSSDGLLLATADLNGMLKIWRASNGKLEHTLEGPGGGIEWLAWHPRGHIILAGSEDFTSWMWNADSGAFMQVFTGHSGPVTCGKFTPDGKSIVTGGGEGDHSLRVWDPRSGTCSLALQDEHAYHTAGLTALAIRSDSSAVCSASEDHSARLVNLQSGKVLGVLAGHTESVEAVAFIGNPPLVATASVDMTLRIWDTNSWTQRALCMHPEAVVRIACHPSQPLIVSACLDGCARLWDVLTGHLLQTYHGHKEAIQDLSVSPRGTHLLTSSDDSSCRVFDLASQN